jgi:uncharacterized membrane protein YtjA (UPF0391 family)
VSGLTLPIDPLELVDWSWNLIGSIVFREQSLASWDGDYAMLYWALVFLLVALVAGALGFGGIAGASAGIAKILFFVFLVLLLISLVAHLTSGRSVP